MRNEETLKLRRSFFLRKKELLQMEELKASILDTPTECRAPFWKMRSDVFMVSHSRCSVHGMSCFR